MQPVMSPPGQTEPGMMQAAQTEMSVGGGVPQEAEPEPEPEPEPPPPPVVQSFGHDAALSPASHTLLPHIGLLPPPPPPPLPQSAEQDVTSLAAQTASPQTLPPVPAASGVGSPLPSSDEQPITNDAQTNTSALILIIAASY